MRYIAWYDKEVPPHRLTFFDWWPERDEDGQPVEIDDDHSGVLYRHDRLVGWSTWRAPVEVADGVTLEVARALAVPLCPWEAADGEEALLSKKELVGG